MIASCYVGSRDYAFGRFDQYMLPYYEKAVADGMTEDEAAEMLAGFFVKCNEICGRTTHNYKKKPILSNATLFGVDLYEVGLAGKVQGLLQEMLAGPGAVRACLKAHV